VEGKRACRIEKRNRKDDVDEGEVLKI